MPVSVCRGNSFKSVLPSVTRPTMIPPSSSRAVRFVDPFGSSDEEAEQSSEDDDRVGLLLNHHINSSGSHVHGQHRLRSKSNHSSKPSTDISLGDLLRRLDRMGYEPTSPSNSPPRSSRSSFSSSSSANSSSSSSVSSLSSSSSNSSSSLNSPIILHPVHPSSTSMAPCSNDSSHLGLSYAASRARSVSPVSVVSVEPSSSRGLPSTPHLFETTSSTGLAPNKNRPKARSMSISILPVLHEHVDEKLDARSLTLSTPDGRAVDHGSIDRGDCETDRKRKRRCSAEGRLEVLKEEREETF